MALLSLEVARLNDRVGSLDASSASTDLNHLVQAALANPDAQKVDLASAMVASATDAEVVILPSGSAYLVNKGLPPLQSDQTYQLWGRTDTPTDLARCLGKSSNQRRVQCRPVGEVPRLSGDRRARRRRREDDPSTGGREPGAQHLGVVPGQEIEMALGGALVSVHHLSDRPVGRRRVGPFDHVDRVPELDQ